MREIEVKLRVNNLEELEQQLKDVGLTISKEIVQHDVIYSNANDTHSFIESYEGCNILRIRNENGVSIMNLKQQRSGEMDNIEYETEVKDGDAMHNILLLLGWKPEVEVKKVRKKGKLGGYEICLDRVEQLGDFVELEKLTDENVDPEKVRDELFKELEKFGLKREQEETKGYDTQIYLLNKNRTTL